MKHRMNKDMNRFGASSILVAISLCVVLFAGFALSHAAFAQETTVDAKSEERSDSDTKPSSDTGGGSGGSPTVEEDCDADIRDFLKNSDGTPFTPLDGTSNIEDDGTQAKVEVKNFSNTCSYNVHLASYNVFVSWGQPDFISTQTLFDADSEVLSPGETYSFTTPVPSCARQLDLFEGPNVPQTNPDFAHVPLLNTHAMLDFDLTSGGGIPLCEDNPPTPDPICTGPTTGQINTPYTFTASAGTAPYTWAVLPTTNFIPTNPTGAGATVTKSFFTAGVKTITFTDDNDKTAECRITITTTPPQKGYIKVIKNVINDDGGTATVPDFRLFVGSTQVTSSVEVEVPVGTYTVRENNLPGYDAGAWAGDCSVNGTVSVGANEHKVCRITNDDNPDTLPAPICELFAQPVTIQLGGSSTLSWTSQYATTAVINQGVGSVPVNGSTSVSPTQTTTYTGTFTGPRGTVVCDAIITVTTEPTATLRVIKNVINDDGGTAVVSDFRLFVNRTAVQSGVTNTFLPGTYNVSEINLPGYNAGSWTGDCAADGTVTLAAGDTKTCRITNDDAPDTTPVPICELFAKPTTIFIGDSSTLTWTSQNVTEAVIDHGVGSVAVNGSTEVSPVTTTTYTGTFSGKLGTVVCDATITVVPPDSDVATLKLIKIVINDDGGTAVVSDFKLYVGNSQVISGDQNIFPVGSYNVHEANLSGYEAGSWTGDCSADGSVTLGAGDSKTCTIVNDDTDGGPSCTSNCGGGGGGGGGSRRPNVVLFSETDPSVLGEYISLDQVPYTGLASSIAKIALFVLGLLALSGGAVYLVARKRMKTMYAVAPIAQTAAPTFAKATAGEPIASVAPVFTEAPAFAQASAGEPTADFGAYSEYEAVVAPAPVAPRPAYVATAPQNLPGAVAVASVAQAPKAMPRVAEVSIEKLQEVARSNRALVSDDAVKLIAASAEGDEAKARERLSQVLEVAKTRYPREDGWLILDKERVRESLFISVLGTVPLFIEWLVRGEDKKIFTFLRMMKHQEQPVADFVRKVVAELDNVHRARLEGAEDSARVNTHVAEVTYHLAHADLEAIISELLSGVDERYESAYTSVRLALVRVLDVIKERSLRTVGGAYAFADASVQTEA